MFDRLRHIVGAGTDLAAAGAMLFGARAGAVALRGALVLALGLVGAIGLIGVLAGVTVLIVPAVGVAPAILIVCSSTLVVSGASVCVLLRGMLPGDRLERAHESVNEARAQLAAAIPGSGRTDDAGSPDGAAAPDASGRDSVESGVSRALIGALSEPDKVAGAAFALVSVLGVGRTVRLVRTAASVAGSGAVVARAIQNAQRAAEAEGHARAPCSRAAADSDTPAPTRSGPGSA